MSVQSKTKKHGHSLYSSRFDPLFHFLNYSFFFLFTLICVYPFYYIIINSLSNGNQVDLGNVMFYPIGFQLENYKNVMQLDNIYHSALVSVLRTIIGTASSVLVTVYAAYFFTKREMWGRKFWYRMVIATMYFNAGLIPGFMNIKSLGLYNSFWVYIIPGLISVYNMVLIKTFIETIPAEMEESAQIDGAGVIRRLFQIIIPLSVPIIATVALFQAVGQWNSFMDTLLFITNKNLYTLQYILQMYFKQADIVAKQMMSGSVSAAQFENLSATISATSIRLTVTVIVTFPILMVYPFVQKFFVKGIMVGAVKG